MSTYGDPKRFTRFTEPVEKTTLAEQHALIMEALAPNKTLESEPPYVKEQSQLPSDIRVRRVSKFRGLIRFLLPL